MMDSGSHIVLGTVLIRTSSQLTATQQKNLTAVSYTHLDVYKRQSGVFGSNPSCAAFISADKNVI